LQKEYSAALESYDRAIAINPNFHEAWYERGNALAELGRHEYALLNFDRAISIEPNFALASPYSNSIAILKQLRVTTQP
jgi:tetratricopeptide (TPR) repeat protein